MHPVHRAADDLDMENLRGVRGVRLSVVCLSVVERDAGCVLLLEGAVGGRVFVFVCLHLYFVSPCQLADYCMNRVWRQ